MSDDLTLTVSGVDDRRPVIGGDTVIATTPNVFVDIEGQPVLVIQRLAKILSDLAHESARGVGEELHHGVFVMTTDPNTVASFGIMHLGCNRCEDGVSDALHALSQEPDRPLLVGQLFWAGP